MSGIPSPSHLSTLPVPLTSFIGRDREIAVVADLLSRPDLRLLTITGPGGIGKTRLALRAGEQCRDQFTDGVVFISLAPVRDAELVVPTLAKVLGIADNPSQPALVRLRAFLWEKHLLLVLDNLEHLLESAADLVADLLTYCPNLTVLCTSRTRLGISGEYGFPLDALSPEPARVLFAARAQASLPAFAVTPEKEPVIDAVCERLDRLPLAIELAAARINVLSPHALLARLEQSLDLLRGGPRDAPPRQRDMRQAIAWSHDLLTASDQMLFRRLGVFVGGFTLEAAQSIMDLGADAFEGISTLVAASLVKPISGFGDEPRFTMLETIREFAVEQLAASGEEPEIQRAHAQYVVTLAERAWDLPAGPLTDAAMQRLRPETGNIRVALGWTLEHEPNDAVQLAAGWLAMDHGELAVAEACLTDAVAGAREETDAKLLIVCLGILGLVALKQNDLERSRQIFEEERALAVTSQPIHMATATASLGQTMMAMGDLAAAQELFEAALAIHKSGSGTTGVAFGHMYLGQVMLARRRYEGAALHFREACSGFANTLGLGGVARALEGFAGVVVTRQPDRAAFLLGAAAAAMREKDHWPRDVLEVPVYEQTVATTRAALGELAFEAAWEAGRQLSEEDVLAEVDSLVATFADPPAASIPEPDVTHGLSPRELEVLHLLVEGRSNRVIGDTLSLSERTVENHVMHILSKLGVESRTAAATYAVRHGLA
ncbi:MAG: LuxR C-terminal-related transcriptional regulator [Chloroflexota bacterium]|nr:LuxR C-terminal-related transcriptional regulator [Chloroflexota bacterium]